MYEPGSTFKLQTAAMALDSGAAQLWNQFDAAHPIKIGRFTITDFEGKHRYLSLPEVLAYSSNLGARISPRPVGSERQRAWLEQMGMFGRLGIELPEAGRPIVPAAANWGEATNLTVGFGHGIAVSPLHVVRGTATLANGGVLLRPTILASEPGDPPREGTRIMQQMTSDTIRKLMRLVVTDGYGKPANIPGYYVGGKTGTAEKTGSHGYKKHTNISAFMSVFPMNAPHYAVYFMLDEPHGNKSTGGYSTAGRGQRAGGRQGDRPHRPHAGACCRTCRTPTPSTSSSTSRCSRTTATPRRRWPPWPGEPVAAPPPPRPHGRAGRPAHRRRAPVPRRQCARARLRAADPDPHPGADAARGQRRHRPCCSLTCCGARRSRPPGCPRSRSPA